MSKQHTVRQGDCIDSIAFRYGFFPETLWDHPGNAELKELRKDPNVLLPGDVVFIPDKGKKVEECQTDARWTFKRRGVPSKLILRLLDEDEPRADEPYTIEIDGGIFVEGTTDGDGVLEHWISPGARKAVLRLQDSEEVYEFDLGHLNPSEEVDGMQGRLAALGVYEGKVDAEHGPETKSALKEFQWRAGLEPTGEYDDDTKKELESAFDGE